MANGINNQFSNISNSRIPHIRLSDDRNLKTRYEKLNKLGQGSFGIVYRVRNQDSKIFYAMKIITKKPGNQSKAFSLDNEVKLLTEVDHPNLIQLYEVLESPQNVYLILELCEGGELGGYIKTNGPLPEETIKQIMRKSINALHYLHTKHVAHRDLKLENILLKKTPTSITDIFDIRITDFGLSSKKCITSTESLFHDHCGTPLYMAPEILENKNYSALCDVWAMGIIMYYLICAHHPYKADEERRLLEIIRVTKLQFDSDKFRNLSSQGRDFLKEMLFYDPARRRTMGELLEHPWLTGRPDKELTKDIITQMKEFNVKDDQPQKKPETSLAGLINATANHQDPSTTVDDQSEVSSTMNTNDIQYPLNETKNNTNVLEKRPLIDRSKTSLKIHRSIFDTRSRRSINAVHDTNSIPSNTPMKSRPNDMISNLINSDQNYQINNRASIINVTKSRASNVRLGRSQSQIDRPSTSRLSLQPQRTTLNDSIHTKLPSSSTMTAIMMINKQQFNGSPPLISNQQRHSMQKIPLYNKRYSNQT
ncbi:unnamed protein product [Adineta steineri]|uniref:Protein kinase domain-containing protein n=1 Tax=Adineta steineri TaxID=433720 RepID=A0A814Q0I2_9BILA|nr:unnamed protein product [Adineta steineri]CAF3950546.1 unnamed protein product [Adineta steineri]